MNNLRKIKKMLAKRWSELKKQEGYGKDSAKLGGLKIFTIVTSKKKS